MVVLPDQDSPRSAPCPQPGSGGGFGVDRTGGRSCVSRQACPRSDGAHQEGKYAPGKVAPNRRAAPPTAATAQLRGWIASATPKGPANEGVATLPPP